MKAANQQLESKFKGGPHIWCERLGCNISIGGCRARHEKAVNPNRRSIGGFWTSVPYDPGCGLCQQYRQIEKGKWEAMVIDMAVKIKERQQQEKARTWQAEKDATILESVDHGKKETSKKSTSDLKQCRVCKQRLPMDAFTKNNSEQDGLDPLCKSCKHDRQKRYRDKIVAQRKKSTTGEVMAVMVDFSEREDTMDMLEKLKKRAEINFRTIECQILYELTMMSHGEV